MKNRSIMFYIFLSGIAIFFYTGLVEKCFAQDPDEPAISYSKKLEVVITNPLDAMRKNETIVIPLASILEKAPDFNSQFYRIKHKTSLFEPLDIPSQIRVIPSMNEMGEELLFQVDLAPREKIIVDLWYNPEGYKYR